MGCRSKKAKGRKSSKFNESQIEIIKNFNAFGVNILKHNTIYGILVSTEEELETGAINERVIGFVSEPIDKISYEDAIEDKAKNITYGVIGDKTCLVDKNFDLEILANDAESPLDDEFGLLSMLQQAVEEGLCVFHREVDILYLERLEEIEEDASNDIKER